MRDDEEREAMEWLDETEFTSDRVQGHKRTIKRMLAEPRLPEKPTPGMLKAICDGWNSPASGTRPEGAYNGLCAELRKPKTRTETFKRWLVVFPSGELGPYADKDEARHYAKNRDRAVVIELTGMGDVPA